MNSKAFVLAVFASFLLISDGQASHCDVQSPFKKSRSSSDAIPMEQDLDAQHKFIDDFSKGEVVITGEELERLNLMPIHRDLVALAYKDDRYALFALKLIHLGFVNRDLVERRNRDILIQINVRANKKIPAALYNLAFMYFHGIGGHTDASFARSCLEKASALGHKQSEQVLKELRLKEEQEIAEMLNANLLIAQHHLGLLPEQVNVEIKEQDNCIFAMDCNE